MPQVLLWLLIVLELAVIAFLLWRIRRSESERERTAAETKFEIQTRMGQDLVRVVRNQRHGFMNHLQVISGWFQLSKPERAMEYIVGLRLKREQEVQIFRVANWELITRLITRSSLAEANEIEINWIIDSHFRWASEEMIAWIERSFDQAFEQLLSTESPRKIEAVFSEKDNRYWVIISCSDGQTYQYDFPVTMDRQGWEAS